MTSTLPTTYEPPYIEREIDALLEHQFRLALSGTESTVVHGAPGTGKTHALNRLVTQTNERVESGMMGGWPSGDARYLEMSKPTGSKGALVDIYEALGEKLSNGSRRLLQPLDLRKMIVDELQAADIRVLVLDEAQMIGPEQMDLVRQLPDESFRRGYPMGLVVGGTPSLRDHIAAIGQLGQRFATEIAFSPLPPDDVRSRFESLHPDLPALRKQVGLKRWQQLLARVVIVTHGNLRRLALVLKNAHEAALAGNGVVDEECLQLALDKLAPET